MQRVWDLVCVSCAEVHKRSGGADVRLWDFHSLSSDREGVAPASQDQTMYVAYRRDKEAGKSFVFTVMSGLMLRDDSLCPGWVAGGTRQLGFGVRAEV